MSAIDYKALFVQTLYEEMGEAFARHGIDSIHEEDFEAIVAECWQRVYLPETGRFRREHGGPTFRVNAPWGRVGTIVGNMGRLGRRS